MAARPRATTDINRAVNRLCVLCEMRFDCVGETIRVRPEKYRIRVVGWERRVKKQLAAQRRQAHGAFPLLAVRIRNLRLLHQLPDFGWQGFGRKRATPTEGVADIVGEPVFGARVDARVSGGRCGGERVAARAQLAAKFEQSQIGIGVKCGHKNGRSAKMQIGARF